MPAFANNSLPASAVSSCPGLTTIGYEDCLRRRYRTSPTVPDSVAVARGLVNNGLDTIELGSQVTERG